MKCLVCVCVCVFMRMFIHDRWIGTRTSLNPLQRCLECLFVDTHWRLFVAESHFLGLSITEIETKGFRSLEGYPAIPMATVSTLTFWWDGLRLGSAGSSPPCQSNAWFYQLTSLYLRIRQTNWTGWMMSYTYFQQVDAYSLRVCQSLDPNRRVSPNA